jgi:hypothetical protein
MTRTRYREEKSYTIRLHLVAEFPDDYEGEEDGYEWHAHFDRTVRPRIARAIVDAFLCEPGWKVTPVARGADDHEELEFLVERIVC